MACAISAKPSSTSKYAQRSSATFKAQKVLRTQAIQVKARRTRHLQISAAASGNIGDSPDVCAWRGDIPPQGSLPLKADGTPDYTTIDASPISKVLTATIRKLLVKEVRVASFGLYSANFIVLVKHLYPLYRARSTLVAPLLSVPVVCLHFTSP